MPFVNDSKRTDMEQMYPLIQMHDDASADHNYLSKLAEEIGFVSGGLIDVHLRVDNPNIVVSQEEDTNPVYWPKKQVKAYFDPPPPVQEVKKWGPDVELKPEIFIPLTVVEREFGRMLRSGDVIIIPNYEPTLGISRFRITSAAPDGNWRYKWYYLKCYTVSLTNDITVQPYPEGQSSTGALDG